MTEPTDYHLTITETAKVLGVSAGGGMEKTRQRLRDVGMSPDSHVRGEAADGSTILRPIYLKSKVEQHADKYAHLLAKRRELDEEIAKLRGQQKKLPV